MKNLSQSGTHNPSHQRPDSHLAVVNHDRVAALECGSQILLETDLRAMTGQLHPVAELVLVASHSSTDLVVDPIAVEDIREVREPVVERQALELGDVDPSRDVLSGLWK